MQSDEPPHTQQMRTVCGAQAPKSSASSVVAALPLRYQRTEAASNTKPQWASQRFLSDLPVASRMYELSEFTKFVHGLPADTPIVSFPRQSVCR